MGRGEVVWLGLDVGGTKVAGGLVDGAGRLWERAELPTLARQGFDVSWGQVLAVARTLLERARLRGLRVAGAGAGFPGPLEPGTAVLHHPPNLPGWDGVGVGGLLAEALGMAVAVERDANAAALAEWHLGAGSGAAVMVYFTLGTGVGGSVICDGRPFAGARGAAAELGHLVVRAGGEPCPCGGRGCLEAYASGPSLVRRLRAALGAKAAGTTADAPGDAVAALEAVRRGQPEALRVWEETMECLAAGVLSAVRAFNPDVVVIGGGLAGAGDLLFGPLERLVREGGMPYLSRDVEIRPAALGRDAGVVGAGLLARERAQGRW